MASIIRIKRSSGILAPSTLKTAELAYAYGTGTQGNAGDRLFIGTGDNGAGGATSITVIGGSYFTDMLDHVKGTLTATSAILVDSDKKIDQLLSGNIVIDGATNKISGLVDPTDSSGVATKRYVDNLTQLTGISLTGDSGSDSVNLADSGLNFQGQAGEIHTKITNNNLLISLDSSGVVAGTYGSTTAVPIIKVDDFGRIDSIGTAPASVIFNVTADSGTGDSVNLLDSALNFSGSNSIVTRVTDNNIDIRLDSTHQATHLASFGAIYPGLYTYGGGTAIARVSVDNFGLVKHIDQTNILAQLTLRDTPAGATENVFTSQNDLIVQGGNSINVNLTKGSGTNDPAIFDISIDSNSFSTIDSVSWGTEPMHPSQYPGTAMQGNDNIVITGTDGTTYSAQIRHFKDSQSFDGTVRTAIQPNTKLYVGGKLQFGNDYANGSNEYSGAGGVTNMFRTQANSNFPEGFTLNEQRNTYLQAANHYIQTTYNGQGFGHDSAKTNNGQSSYNIYMGGHLVAKPLSSSQPAQDIGEDSSYTWNNAYFLGTVKAGSIVLTSGGISVDSGGTISADSATFGGVIADSARLDAIYSRTGQNMTIAPNTDSGGTITIGTRYGYSQAQGNHKLDLTNIGLKAGLIKGEAVGTTSLGSWAIPLQSTNLYNDLGFFGGQSHINIRDNADSALTVTAMTSLGAATADMMRFNTKDSQVHVHVDQVIDNDKNLVLGSGYLFNNVLQTGRTTLRHDTTDHYFMMHADSSITELEIAGKGVTLIGYDVNNAMYSGMGASTGNGLITLDGNVVPGVGRGMGMYNAGFRRDLGSTSLRFGTVYAGHFNRPQVVDSAVYGSQTSIPVLTINSSGLIDSAGTVPLATTLNINADAGTGDVALLDSSIEVSGGFNVNTRVVDNTVTVHLDSDVLGLTSLTVDNVKIDGNTISSTDNSNQLFIDPFPVGDSGDLVVRGNLIVQGTETTVNSTVVSLNDKNLVLADSAANSSAADGAGITVGGAGYSGTKPQFIFDAATARWDPNLPLDIPFASLDSAVFFNGVALREVVEDHLDNFFGVDSNAALTLTYDDVQNSMTWKAINATKSQVGVSSFDSASFTVTAGHVAVTVLDGGTY